MVRSPLYLRLQVSLLILDDLVRRLAMNVPMEPSAFQEFRRSCLPRQMVTTDRIWRHHNHDGMNFCETESRARTMSGGAVTPYRPRTRMPTKRRSSPAKLDFVPTVSSIKLPIVRCESPTAIWECEGDCRSKSLQTTEAAHVVRCMSD